MFPRFWSPTSPLGLLLRSASATPLGGETIDGPGRTLASRVWLESWCHGWYVTGPADVSGALTEMLFVLAAACDVDALRIGSVLEPLTRLLGSSSRSLPADERERLSLLPSEWVVDVLLLKLPVLVDEGWLLLAMLSGWKRVSDASADDTTLREAPLVAPEIASDVEWLTMRLLGRLSSLPADLAVFEDGVVSVMSVVFLARGNGFRMETEG